LPAGERLLVLKPQENGLWGVVWCDRYKRDSGWVAADVAGLGYAMAMAEENVTAEEKRFSRKEGKGARGSMTASQRAHGRRYGIAFPDSTTAGEARVMINQAIGSARIDPYLSPMWRR
jgi:hypothetical protein